MAWDLYYNDDPQCDAKELEKTYGISLGPQSAVMCRTRSTGECFYVLESPDHKSFYLWNQITASIYRVEEPKTRAQIVQSISENGVRGLKIVQFDEGGKVVTAQ